MHDFKNYTFLIQKYLLWSPNSIYLGIGQIWVIKPIRCFLKGRWRQIQTKPDMLKIYVARQEMGCWHLSKDIKKVKREYSYGQLNITIECSLGESAQYRSWPITLPLWLDYCSQISIRPSLIASSSHQHSTASHQTRYNKKINGYIFYSTFQYIHTCISSQSNYYQNITYRKTLCTVHVHVYQRLYFGYHTLSCLVLLDSR